MCPHKYRGVKCIINIVIIVIVIITLLNFNIKVQTRQWNCGGSATCICGVVLRDHNDVIEFNCCNDHMVQDGTTPLRVKIRSNKCLSPGISIKKWQSGVLNVKYQVGLTITIIIVICK